MAALAGPPQPRPIDLIDSYRNRGRAFVAARTIKPGEVILSERPILLYPSATSSLYCHHCFRALPHTPFHCSTCATPFCSVTCHSTAVASFHTPFVCSAYRLLKSLREERRIFEKEQAFFLIAAYNLAVVNPNAFRLLLSLHGRGDPTKASTVILHEFMVSLEPKLKLSVSLTADLLAKDAMNAFGLMERFDKSMEDGDVKLVRGYGIYFNAAFFNHDCLPNACRFDYLDGDVNVNNYNANTEISIRAIHEISKGREVCLSYFPVNWAYKERQKRLVDDYGFQCLCERCEVEKKWKTSEEEEEMEVKGSGGGVEVMEFSNGDADDSEEFPHAYFFLNFMCSRVNCGGTLAHLPPSLEGVVSDKLECNGCGLVRDKDDIDYDVDEDDEEEEEEEGSDEAMTDD